jgi:hypothetical protein
MTQYDEGSADVYRTLSCLATANSHHADLELSCKTVERASSTLRPLVFFNRKFHKDLVSMKIFNSLFIKQYKARCKEQKKENHWNVTN